MISKSPSLTGNGVLVTIQCTRRVSCTRPLAAASKGQKQLRGDGGQEASWSDTGVAGDEGYPTGT